MTGSEGLRPQANWGRWGAEDERGAANLLTPDAIRAAAGLVRRGRVYSLALPMQSRKVPVLPGRSPVQHFMSMDGGDYAAGLRRRVSYKSSDDYIMAATHGTTHVDSLAHVGYGDEMYNGHSGNLVRSREGAIRNGIDKLSSLVGRGVLLDIAAYKDVEHLEADYAITAADLRDCAAFEGVQIRAGDMLLVRTGWLRV